MGMGNYVGIYGSIYQTKSKVRIGYAVVLVAALTAALLHVLGKPLLGYDDAFQIHPIILAAIIFLINGVFFSGLVRNSKPVKSIGKKNLFFLTIIGITEVSALIAFFFGLKESSAVNASIFSNSEILFSIVLAVIVFREKLKISEIGPFSMILFGMTALPIGFELYQNQMQFSSLVFGDMIILLSGLLYAIDINICKYVSDRLDSKRITQITSIVSGIFALCLGIALQVPLEINFEQLPVIAVIGIAGTGLSTLFFFVGLRLLGAVRTVLLYSTTSVFGILFSIVILSEESTVVDFAAVGITLIGIFLLRGRLGDENEEYSLEQDRLKPNRTRFKNKKHKSCKKINQKNHLTRGPGFWLITRLYSAG